MGSLTECGRIPEIVGEKLITRNEMSIEVSNKMSIDLLFYVKP